MTDKNKRISPFSKEFWINKGYSESEADYKRNSIRSIRWEYWCERGYTKDEAIRKATETKQNNNKKGNKKSVNRSKKELYESSPRRIEYWIKRGFNEDEAKSKVSEIQTTFSKKKCIEKYGYEKGILVWSERQEKWKKSLESKSAKEITSINFSKSRYRRSTNESIKEYINRLKGYGCCYYNIEGIVDYTKKLMNRNIYYRYMPVKEFMDKVLPVSLWYVIKEFDIKPEDVESNISHLFDSGSEYLMTKGNKQSYRKWVGSSILRSSYEIYFYDRFTNLFPGKEISIDRPYDSNKKYRYDFKCFGEYIEICPCIHTDEKYKQKMFKK